MNIKLTIIHILYIYTSTLNILTNKKIKPLNNINKQLLAIIQIYQILKFKEMIENQYFG